MFTGIVQAVAVVSASTDRPGLRSFTLQFPAHFCDGLEIGASVSCDGVCLTVTSLVGPDAAEFDVMQQTLSLTTLAALAPGSRINVERAARDGLRRADGAEGSRRARDGGDAVGAVHARGTLRRRRIFAADHAGRAPLHAALDALRKA